MITSLDPHSRYMNAKGWPEMQETTRGEFGGLGMEVTMEDGLVKVVAPIDDTPAAKAGIMSGDLITHVDDEAIQGLTLESGREKMKGPPNSTARLTIIRKGADKPINVSIVREDIRVRSVRYRSRAVTSATSGFPRSTSRPPRACARRSRRYRAKSLRKSSRAMWWTCATIRAGCSTRRFRYRAYFLGRGEVVSTRGRNARRPSVLPRAAVTSPRASRWSS